MGGGEGQETEFLSSSWLPTVEGRRTGITTKGPLNEAELTELCGQQ